MMPVHEYHDELGSERFILVWWGHHGEGAGGEKKSPAGGLMANQPGTTTFFNVATWYHPDSHLVRCFCNR